MRAPFLVTTNSARHRFVEAACVLAGLAVSVTIGAEPVQREARKPTTDLKSESVDHDPNWEASNNRLVTISGATISQDFGYSETSFATQTKGEIGGRVSRSRTGLVCGKDLAQNA